MALAKARDAQGEAREATHFTAARLATLTSQLESAEQRLADLDRQHARLERDRSDADRLTSDAAQALSLIPIQMCIRDSL